MPKSSGGGGSGGRPGGGGGGLSGSESQIVDAIETGKISSNEFHAATDAMSRQIKETQAAQSALLVGPGRAGRSRSEIKASAEYRAMESKLSELRSNKSKLESAVLKSKGFGVRKA